VLSAEIVYSPRSGRSYECGRTIWPTFPRIRRPLRIPSRLALDWDTPLTGLLDGLTALLRQCADSLLNPGSPTTREPRTAFTDAQLPKISFLDMRVSYNINKVTVRGGDNVLDKDPRHPIP